MQGSHLVYGTDTKSRLRKIFEILEQYNLTDDSNSPDLLIVELEDKNSIGIEKVRELTKFLSTKPFSGDKKAVIINDAHKLTEQAQNALLKILEEPPEYSALFLSVNSENDLLATVISRCQRIIVRDIVTAEFRELEEEQESDDLQDTKLKSESKTGKSNDEDIINITFSEIYGRDIRGKFDSIESVAKLERNEVGELLAQWIKQARNQGAYSAIVKIQKLKEDLDSSNLNLKLGLEWLMINL